jgi:hypothetical protein
MFVLNFSRFGFKRFVIRLLTILFITIWHEYYGSYLRIFLAYELTLIFCLIALI